MVKQQSGATVPPGMLAYEAERNRRRIIGDTAGPPTVMPPPTSFSAARYAKAPSAGPMVQPIDMGEEEAWHMRYEQDLRLKWQEYAENHAFSNPAQHRYMDNADDTKTSTLHCSVGVFNLGNLCRQQHPGGHRINPKVAPGEELTTLVRFLLHNYCHIMLVCEGSGLDVFEEDVAYNAISYDLVPDTNLAVMVKGFEDDYGTRIERLKTHKDPGCNFAIWIINFGKIGNTLGVNVPISRSGLTEIRVAVFHITNI